MQQKSKNTTASTKSLFDTSAIIAVLKKEANYEMLEEVIGNSAITTVNLSELVAVLARCGVIEEEINEIIKDIVPEVIPFTTEIAVHAGKLIKLTASSGLSLGDRACIATGMYYNMRIYTTDKAWLSLNLDKADIVLVR